MKQLHAAGALGDAALRTIVVDHDASALARTLTLLRHEADIEVVGECATGAHALSLVDRARPDLVFLEAHVPHLDGIEFARSLTQNGSSVVFVTAHQQYAVPAFETRAVDYVMKPFSDERFMSAVGRARLHFRASQYREPSRVLRPQGERRSSRRRLFVKSNGRVIVLRTRDIAWCEAVGNYVRLHTGQEAHMMRATLTHLEAQLDPRQFVRVHRSTIVNVDFIRELTPSSNGEFALQLQGEGQVTLSRGYRRSFERAVDVLL